MPLPRYSGDSASRPLHSSWLLVPILALLLAGLTHPVAAAPYPADAAALEILVDGRLRGSGWLATPGGLAITAAHVVRAARTIEIVQADSTRTEARLLAVDLGHDLALLKLETRRGLLPTLELSPTPPGLDAPLILHGSPLNRHRLILPGRLARTTTSFEWNEVNRCYTRVFPVAAMTPEGLSGGPWLDASGRIVGVQSGMMTRQDALMGIAFMSPAQAVRALLDTRRDASTNWLGATLVEAWEGPAAGSEQPGLRIDRIVGSGPAQRAGLRAGDRIVSIGKKQLVYRDQLLRELRALPGGGTVPLEVMRDGEKLEISLPLLPREQF